MKLNMTVRLKNKAFWLAMIPAILLLIKEALSVAGIDFDTTQIEDKLVAIVGTVFTILAIMGVCVDPTTSGLSDSENALTYTEPKEDAD